MSTGMWSAPGSAEAKYGFLGANPAPMVTLFVLASEAAWMRCNAKVFEICSLLGKQVYQFVVHKRLRRHSCSKKYKKKELYLLTCRNCASVSSNFNSSPWGEFAVPPAQHRSTSVISRSRRCLPLRRSFVARHTRSSLHWATTKSKLKSCQVRSILASSLATPRAFFAPRDDDTLVLDLVVVVLAPWCRLW